MPKPWKTLSSEMVLHTPGVNIRKDHVVLPNGKAIENYYVFEFNEWATIIPVTEDNQVVLVRQYRHGVGQVTYEFPAGLADPDDADPLETAKRELREESGYTSEDWTGLGSYSLGPSKIKNKFHLYCARNCRLAGVQKLDEFEDIQVVTVSLTEMENLLRQGQIHDVDSALAWLLCKNYGLIDSALIEADAYQSTTEPSKAS